MLRLNLFGTPSVTADNGPLTGRATRGRRLALLALLACKRGRPVRRDLIMALLSPESPTDRARAQLSDDLYILRTGLGEDVVTSAGDEIALNEDVIRSDVATFEGLLEEGEAEQAVALVAGPLLDGFHLADSPEFEQWLDSERTRLAMRYATALESLADAAEAAADFGTASAWWRRLAEHDPFSDRVTLRLMRALEANGDRAGAIRCARVHTTLLQEELDAAPTPEVLAFAERLRTEPRTRSAVEPLPGPDSVRATPARADVADGSHAAGVGEGAAAPEPSSPEPTPRTVPAGRSVFLYATAVVVLLVLTIVGVDALVDASSQPSETAPSIAVLPFVNLSASADDAYFSDGLTEQIIATLSRVEGLHVAARTSSFGLRDLATDVRSIGDTLGVATVLEGSVRREGRRMRITAQLIDAASGYHLWTEEYDRQQEEIIDVQTEIAGAIARELRLRLKPSPTTAPPRNLEAYDLYLRALYLRNTLKPDELGQALEFFDRAIALEPTFALAYAGKASVIAPAVYFRYMPQEEGVAELRRLVDRALELDPTLGEAHTALGIVRLFWDWDWPSAERSLRRAVELNPSDAHAYHHLGNYFTVMMKFEDVVAARSRSLELDPLNPRTITLLAGDYLRLGDHERALELYERAMKLDPVHPLLVGFGPGQPAGPGKVLEAQGRYGEAVEEYARIAVLRGAMPAEVEAMHHAFASGGMPAFWRAWIDMDQRQMAHLQDPVRMGGLWILAADTAQAMEWLDRAYEERSPGLIYLGRALPSPLDGMADHPRVAPIMAAMKLPHPARRNAS